MTNQLQRTIGLLRRVVRDCNKLYGQSAQLMIRRHPTELSGSPLGFQTLMQDLAHGLIVKTYVTVARADGRWSGAEKKLAAAIIELLWDQTLDGEDLREAATGLFHQSDALTWKQLVAPFVRHQPLHPLKAKVETIVIRLANLVAKCDDDWTPDERKVLHEIQDDIERALYKVDSVSSSNAASRSVSVAVGKKTKSKEKAAGEEITAVDEAPAAMSEEERKASLQSAMDELDSLIGLDSVKKQIRSYANFLRLQQTRSAKGLSTMPISLHMAFLGNPGTGKTTVARIVGQILGAMGTLPSGHMVETDRGGLVAEYAGQTAGKTNTLCDSAGGGVLFIDEAYSLIDPSGEDAFGREAIQTLLKRMEDDRESMAVVLAGYTDEMDTMIRSNPGLSSRINTKIDFPDYQPVDLGRIFERLAKQNDYVIPADSRHRLLIGFDRLFAQRDEHFGNGRTVRNAFENSVRRLADRISSLARIDESLLTRLEPSDISMPGVSTKQLDQWMNRPHELRWPCRKCGKHIRVETAMLGSRIRCVLCQARQHCDWSEVRWTS